MVLTIKNFGNPVGPGVVETAPTNLVGVAGTLKATLTWTSATGESGVVWTEEKLVRKEGSAPQGSMDGTVVTTITTKDTYASTGYEDTELYSTKTYYYKVFAIYDNGTERGSSDVNVAPIGWVPGANTLAYYPLETDTKDYSGNGRDGTNNGVTFSNGLGVFNGSSYVSLGTGSRTNIQTNMTINAWFKWNGNGSKDNVVIGKTRYIMPNIDRGYYIITIHDINRYLCGGYYSGSEYNIHPMNFRTTGGGSPTLGPVAQANKWYNVVITNDGNTKKAYVDGVLYATENVSSTTSTLSIDTRIGSLIRYDYDSFFNGNISAVIFEDKTRTAHEVSDYYNKTKGNYGL